jgi:hypothetical protein
MKYKADRWESIVRHFVLMKAAERVMIKGERDIPDGYREVDAVGARLRANKADNYIGPDKAYGDSFIAPTHIVDVTSGMDMEYLPSFYVYGGERNKDWEDARYEYRVYAPVNARGACKIVNYESIERAIVWGRKVIGARIVFKYFRYRKADKVYVLVVDRRKKTDERVG